ncbi:MAG: enoyl-CoA hydratase/isomerase family protein [Dehalococcoidia bacterium]
MAGLISIERDGGVALVRMLRTDKHNAFNRELSQAFIETMDALEADDDVRCVVLTGSGAAFCAGADMNEAVTGIDDRGRSDGMATAILREARFPKPLVGCIDGFAYGGGALLAACCDVRIASSRAAFRFPGAAYGLVVGASQLPAIVGPAYAKELLFSGRVVDAAEAERIGLVNRVVPDAEAAAMELAREIAANSPAALVATKQVVDRAVASGEAAALEADHNRELRASPEHHQRFRAAADRVAKRGKPR